MPSYLAGLIEMTEKELAEFEEWVNETFNDALGG